MDTLEVIYNENGERMVEVIIEETLTCTFEIPESRLNEVPQMYKNGELVIYTPDDCSARFHICGNNESWEDI